MQQATKPDPYGDEAVPITPKVDSEIRCRGKRTWEDEHGQHFRSCAKLLAVYVARPWKIQCPRCKHVNHAE